MCNYKGKFYESFTTKASNLDPPRKEGEERISNSEGSGLDSDGGGKVLERPKGEQRAAKRPAGLSHVDLAELTEDF